MSYPQNSKWLFCDEKGDQINYDELNAWFQNHMKRMDPSGNHGLHGLRKTAILIGVMLGASDADLQKCGRLDTDTILPTYKTDSQTLKDNAILEGLNWDFLDEWRGQYITKKNLKPVYGFYPYTLHELLSKFKQKFPMLPDGYNDPEFKIKFRKFVESINAIDSNHLDVYSTLVEDLMESLNDIDKQKFQSSDAGSLLLSASALCSHIRSIKPLYPVLDKQSYHDSSSSNDSDSTSSCADSLRNNSNNCNSSSSCTNIINNDSDDTNNSNSSSSRTNIINSDSGDTNNYNSSNSSTIETNNTNRSNSSSSSKVESKTQLGEDYSQRKDIMKLFKSSKSIALSKLLEYVNSNPDLKVAVLNETWPLDPAKSALFSRNCKEWLRSQCRPMLRCLVNHFKSDIEKFLRRHKVFTTKSFESKRCDGNGPICIADIQL